MTEIFFNFQSIPAKPLHTPEIDTVSYIQKQKDGTVFFRISTHDEESGSRFFLWNYVEDWEIWADIYYCGAPADYFCWKNDVSSYKIGSTESLPENRLVNKELYQCDPQNDRFSVLYSVVVFQKSLSKEAYEYYQNKMKLNEDMGGLFTPQPFEITGNIACITDQSKKVMGYVEVIKNTAQKRIFVPRDSITRQPVVTNCKALSLDYVTKNNIDVTGMIMLCEEGGWTYPSCTKCRTKGGTKNKPDFWPNN